MKKRSALFLALLALCLLALAACGGEEKEETSTSGTVYISESVPFNSPLTELESVCISGDSLYLLGTISDGSLENTAAYASGSLFSLVRVPVDGGKAEKLGAFHPARLTLEGEAKQNSNSGHLRPGADGTLWLTEEVSYWCYDLPEDFDPKKDRDEIYKYVSDRGSSMFLRQLDSEGNELARFEFSDLDEALDADQIYDLWTDGAGTFFANTGDAVVLLDEDGTVRAGLEGDGMAWNHFITLGDGRTAILGTVRGLDGAETCLRVIDTQARAWAEEGFTLPFDAACIQGGDGTALFYYRQSDALYAWRNGAEEPERMMSWSESGVDASSLAAFTFLADERLAAASYTNYYSFNRSANLTLLTPADATSAPERTVLTLGAYILDSEIRAEIAEFNRTSTTCYISATEYFVPITSNEAGLAADAAVEQSVLRMITALTAGEMPDIIYLNRAVPARRLEAQGMLEDLWPYIDNDPDLGRDALMTRPLEAMEYNGGLYRIGGCFSIETLAGVKAVVGDGYTWTYDDLWAAYEKLPKNSPITHVNDTKNDMLIQLVKTDADRFIDWENGTSSFDGEEFRALLEFCNRFPAERDPIYPSGNMQIAISPEDQLALYFGEQLLLPTTVRSFDTFLDDQYLFHEDISYVGWPNEAGRVGSVFEVNGGLTLAITSASEHKEEAWSFLRQWLLPSENVKLRGEGDEYWATYPFPINRVDFEKMAELAMTPVMEEKDGVLQEVPRVVTWTEGVPADADMSTFDFDSLFQLKGEIYAMTQEEYDQLMELYNTAEGTSDYDMNLMNIIIEQAGPYFAGDKSLDDTVASIQGRVGLYLAELQ